MVVPTLRGGQAYTDIPEKFPVRPLVLSLCSAYRNINMALISKDSPNIAFYYNPNKLK